MQGTHNMCSRPGKLKDVHVFIQVKFGKSRLDSNKIFCATCLEKLRILWNTRHALISPALIPFLQKICDPRLVLIHIYSSPNIWLFV